jgi:hypothetical protein
MQTQAVRQFILHHFLRYDLSRLTQIGSVLRLICWQRKFCQMIAQCYGVVLLC